MFDLFCYRIWFKTLVSTAKILNYRFPKNMQILREFVIEVSVVRTQLCQQFPQDIASEIESLAIQLYKRRSPEEI